MKMRIWRAVLLFCCQWLIMSGVDCHEYDNYDDHGRDEYSDESNHCRHDYFDEIYLKYSTMNVSYIVMRMPQDQESNRIICGTCFPESSKDNNLDYSVSTEAKTINIKLMKRAYNPRNRSIVEEINVQYMTVSSDEMDEKEEYMYALNFRTNTLLRKRVGSDTNLSVETMRYWPTSGISCLFRGLAITPTVDGRGYYDWYDYYRYSSYSQKEYSGEQECLFSTILLNKGLLFSVSVTAIVLLSVFFLTM